MTLVAIDVAGGAVGAVGLGPVDDELRVAERAGRTPWILGMVVAAESRKLGVGRQLLENLQDLAASLGHPRTWVATGREAVGFYQRCGWAAVEHLRLESTGIPTTILTKPTKGRTTSMPWSPARAVDPNRVAERLGSRAVWSDGRHSRPGTVNLKQLAATRSRDSPTKRTATLPGR